MNLQRLNPWNWLKHEDFSTQVNAPKRNETDYSVVSRTNHPLAQLHHEMDQLFEDAFHGFGFPSRYSRRAYGNGLLNNPSFQAKLNISSDDKNYHISLEIPGLNEQDISLDLNEGTLTVRGEKKDTTETKDRQYHRIEHTYGSFQRVIALPEDTDQDNIKANVKNGILDIDLPRKALPESTSKRIPINN